MNNIKEIIALLAITTLAGPLGCAFGGSMAPYPAWSQASPGAPGQEPLDPSSHNTEAYARIDENPFLSVGDQPLSTFAVDVDTASYANVRRFLTTGQLPPADAVRIEELINYFSYDYPQPDGTDPFSVSAEVSSCPWATGHKLVHIGLQGRALAAAAMPPRNLVFLLDVSGSMASPDKLPLLKAAMRLLVEQLTARDRVAIVVYAGASGLVLSPTPGDLKQRIIDAMENLQAGGSTNGGAGIELAYRLARDQFQEGGINRVILATDGDFNVGTTSDGALTRLIEREREGGIFLTVLGLGRGNLKDSTMERLADRGNGNYAYIDRLSEARKVLVTEAGGTLVTIAKDVKIQVEFNPARVARYRLIGYENRLLRAEDFNDDSKDAGEIGAGHTVTALYEVVPAAGAAETPSGIDPLRYQSGRQTLPAALGDELVQIKLRYKAPNGQISKLITGVIPDVDQAIEQSSADQRFSAAVAAYGMLLRDSKHKGSASFALVRALAQGSCGRDEQGLRAEFLELSAKAAALAKQD